MIDKNTIVMYVYWTLYLATTQYLLIKFNISMTDYGFLKWIIVELIRVFVGFMFLNYLYENYFSKNDNYLRGRK